MAVIELKRTPSAADLRWFGLIQLGFFGLLGAVILWQSGSLRVAAWLWATGAGLAAFYYAVPPVRRLLYALWMTALHPIGWVFSNALLGAIFFLLITPIGWIRRAFGHDALNLRADDALESYWIAEDPGGDPSRYYRQS